jgi:hypothetical protein
LSYEEALPDVKATRTFASSLSTRCCSASRDLQLRISLMKVDRPRYIAMAAAAWEEEKEESGRKPLGGGTRTSSYGGLLQQPSDRVLRRGGESSPQLLL